MRFCINVLRWLGLAALLVAAASPSAAQEREYYITGKVLDANKQPIAGVVIELRERESRRAYRISTDAHGVYKLVGLPHGIYEVQVTKPTYKERSFEWDLHQPQDRLCKVEYDPLVLLSEAQVTEIKRDTQLKTELEEATARVRDGEFDKALDVLAKMLADSPDDVNALYLSGICRLQKGQFEAATGLLEKVVQLAPDFVAARVQLAACYEQHGDKDRALETYDAALKREPGNLLALYNAGVLHYNAGRAAQALPYFEKAVRVKPDDDKSLEMAGYCQLQALEYSEALDYLERARALITDPQRAAALDEILKELRPRVRQAPAPGNGG
jgi:tetratricopeptide (TPR) repeat protein